MTYRRYCLRTQVSSSSVFDPAVEATDATPLISTSRKEDGTCYPTTPEYFDMFGFSMSSDEEAQTSSKSDSVLQPFDERKSTERLTRGVKVSLPRPAV